MNAKQLILDSRRRQKLFNGAVLDHPSMGRLSVELEQQEGHSDHWLARAEDGKQATPVFFSERGLHFWLRRYASYQVVNSLRHLEAPPPPPDPWQDPKLKAAQADWLRRHNIRLS